MTSLPGSFDGAEGDVLDETGRVVASVAVDDQRFQPEMPSGKPGRIEGEVYACFEDADYEWANRLPRAFGDTSSGAPLSISIVLSNGKRLDGVQVSPPWQDGPGPIHSLHFPLSHPEL
jgi:hypothetical protein